MILVLANKQDLERAKQKLTAFGLEHNVLTPENEVWIEFSAENSIYHPAELEEQFKVFGTICGTVSKTPRLDQTLHLRKVTIPAPSGKVVVFQAGGSPIWIAGPCAIDEDEFLHITAKHLSALGVQVLRGGAVKPRTSPHDFQGVGRQGFRWLADIAHEHGMLAVSEALSEEDIPEAMEYLDIIQVGARNMQNFSLLKKLGKGKRPILLKRAPGASLKEWALSAEYLLDGGNEQIILCERGVRGLERELRYTLDFAGALWMQKRYRLPVIIDPSHATGTKALIPEAVAGAIAMGFAGVMVEVHPEPILALSDALQALTLEEFSHLKKYDGKKII